MSGLKDYCRRCGKRTGDDVTSIHTCTPNPVILALEGELAELRKDAERYALLRRGQHWSVVDGIGNTLRAENLDEAIDRAMEGK